MVQRSDLMVGTFFDQACRDNLLGSPLLVATHRLNHVLLQSERSGDALTLHMSGRWCIENIAQVESSLATLEAGEQRRVVIDYAKIEMLDLSSAWLLHNRLERLVETGASIEFSGEPPAHFQFIDGLGERQGEAAEPPAPAERPTAVARLLAWVGKASVTQLRQTRAATGFFGRIALTMVQSLRRWHRLRMPSITRHIYETGIQAIPIVSLIAFLISVIIAYLSAQQLRQFGADIFTVDLVAIAVLREMGVLLTAIIVAGRSGSAFAAEIGVMQLNEEIDALQSMGVDYFEVLVQPRVIGLIIALPLLTIVADAMGLAGGALLSYLLLGIDLSQFIPRVQDALAPTTFWAGLIKAPVFALLIALVGTYRGMQVRESSRDLGRLVTIAVVESIFLVIFADAIFAIVFVELDF
jgi:phospholipid/cholesterol/gamma-HCH transport system permease protein